MAQEIILSKESNGEEIKRYFESVLKLSQSDNEFPINLDEVWMLVYPRKDHAVRALEENFIQDVDFQVSPKNGENPNGGRPTNIYKLTVSCLEYFIARKVRPVFEVYRKVFHKVAQQSKPQLPTDYLSALKELVKVEEEKQLLMLESKKQQEQIEAQRPAVAFTAAVQAAQSSCLVGELAKIISQNGIEIGEKRLFKWLRENKYLGSHGERYNIPNQEYVERGYFELKKGVRSGSNGVMHTTVTTKVTGKGQVYFVNKFLGNSKGMGGESHAV